MRIRKTTPRNILLGMLLTFVLFHTSSYAQNGVPQACPVTMKDGTHLEQIISYPAKIQSIECDNGTEVWRHPYQGRWSDDRYAELSLTQMQLSQCLYLSDFEFDIPPGSQVHGIELWIEGHVEGRGIRPDKIRLTNADGMAMSSNMAKAAEERDWVAGQKGQDATWHYGGKSTDWGVDWTATDINDPDFGVVIRLSTPFMDDTTVVRIDDVHLKVYFTPINRVCNDSCAAFIVEPYAQAYGYFWELPDGAYINSEDPNKNAISINTQDLEDGVYDICVKTMSMYGLSEPCCLPFLKEVCQQNTVGDKVWSDLNRNGIQDAGEPGLSGIPVDLISARKHRKIQGVVTDKDGHFLFENIDFGLYYLRFEKPVGLIFTTPGEGADDSLNSDVTGYYGEGTTRSFYLGSGEVRLDWDAGLIQPCTAEAGVLTTGTISYPCIPDTGVILEVQPPVGAKVPAGYTARYLLVRGASGVIEEVQEQPKFRISEKGIWEVYYFVFQPLAGQGEYFDLARIQTGQTEITALAALLEREHLCSALSDAPARYEVKDCGTIQGIVWDDENENGLRDSGESTVEDIEVVLLGGAGGVLASTRTDSTGFYAFQNLPAAAYRIRIVLPNDFEATLRDAGMDDSVDSDIDSDGKSSVLSLDGDTQMVDAGLIFPCSAFAGSLRALSLSTPCLGSGGSVEVSVIETGDAMIPTDYSDLYLLVDNQNATIIAQSDAPKFELSRTGTYTVARFVFQGNPNKRKYFNPTRINLNSTTLADIEGILEAEHLCGDVTDAPLSLVLLSCGRIAGQVWEDRNHDALRQGGEPGLDAVTVQLLDATKVVLSEQLTGSDGHYAFDNLLDAHYFIQVKKQPGDRFVEQGVGGDPSIDSDVDSTGLSREIAVSGDEHTVDAGLNLECTVFAGTLRALPLGDPCFVGGSTTLQADPVNDAIVPAGYEEVFILVSSSDSLVRKIGPQPGFEVSSSGEYDIYRLVAHPRAGHRGYVDLNQIKLDSSRIKEIEDQITQGYICADLSDVAAHFVVNKCGFLAGRVWHDVDKDGEQKRNEVGIEQVPVHLIDAGTGDTLSTKLSGNDGIFVFTSLVAGRYRVGVEAPEGFVFSPKDAAPDASDSDVDDRGLTDEIVLGFGDRVIVAAGLYTPCPLQALDARLEMQAPSSDCIDTLPVVLSSTLVHDTVPAGNGRVFLLTDAHHFILDTAAHPSFATTTAGQYQIWQLLWPDDSTAAGYYPLGSRFVLGMHLDSLRSDLESAYVCYRLDSSDHSVVLPQCGRLGNLVWLDNNLNGLQDPGEPGINGVRVMMMDTSHRIVAETYTATDPESGEQGVYQLPIARRDLCYIKFEGPKHLVFTKPLINSDDRMDSDVNHSNGFGTTETMLLEPGSKRMDIDAGMIDPSLLPGSVGDYVWLDVDEDGIQDGFESGVNGIPVALYRQDGSLVARDTTKNDAFYNPGYYRFDSILSGTYYIIFERPSIYQIAPPYSGANKEKNSKITGIRADGATDDFVVGAGQSRMDIDGGFVQVASVGDYVWHDKNADGIQDSTEAGINGIKVYLYRQDSVLVDSAVTARDSLHGTNGYYWFEHLVPGGYFVQVLIPQSFTFSPADIGGNDAKDNDITGTNGPGTSAIFHLSPGEHERDIDAGIYMSSMLGSHVWMDLNGDGMRDPDEDPVPDVTVHLYDSSGVMLATTTTNAQGVYWFESVRAGEHYVQFDPPEDYTFTKHMDTHQNMNSDVTEANGQGTTNLISVGPHKMIMHIDAGLVAQSQLSAYFEAFEAYLEGGVVKLSWTVVDDDDILGFDILRMGESGHSFERIEHREFNATPFLRAQFEAEDMKVKPGEKYFYRIRLILKSGRHVDSKVQSIRLPDRKEDYFVYPVPASQVLFIRSNGSHPDNTSIELRTVDGRMVFRRQHEWEHAPVWEINVESVPEGMYLLRIMDGGRYEIVPITIAR